MNARWIKKIKKLDFEIVFVLLIFVVGVRLENFDLKEKLLPPYPSPPTCLNRGEREWEICLLRGRGEGGFRESQFASPPPPNTAINSRCLNCCCCCGCYHCLCVVVVFYSCRSCYQRQKSSRARTRDAEEQHLWRLVSVYLSCQPASS
jgi:hypothetical protein